MKKSVIKGDFLIADPFIGDPNFERSVVIVCDNNEQGAFGFIVNQRTELTLSDVLEEPILSEIPLYVGGPVENTTLHYVHRRPDLIEGGIQIKDDLYLGGDFEQIKRSLNLLQLAEEDIRFFIGYSGWGEEQLQDELGQDVWIVTSTSTDFLFTTPVAQFWREILRQMGGVYRSIAHYPTDPSLN